MTNQSELDLKSRVFDALEVFELNESARTPSGEKFWQEMKVVIEAYAAEREQSLWAITYDFLHGTDRGLCDEWERAIEGLTKDKEKL